MDNDVEALILPWTPEDLSHGPDELHDPRATLLSKWGEPVPAFVMQGLLDRNRPDHYILMAGYTNYIPRMTEWRRESTMIKELRFARVLTDDVTHLIHRLDTIDFSVPDGTATMSEALLSLRPDGTPMLKILALKFAAYFRIGTEAFEARLTTVLVNRAAQNQHR